MKNQYKYAGHPFTYPIARELILELYAGETLKKSVIRDSVYTAHLERDGKEIIDPKQKDAYISDALNYLRGKGLATNEGTPQGHWKIFGGSPPDDPPDEPRAVSQPNDPPKELPANCVYIYYYPSYRELSELKGEDKWPCKIGCTERGAEKRIKEQVTGMPEHAKEEVVIETSNPLWLESTIRMHLQRKGLHKQDAPGDEWYLINSEIAKEIAELSEDFQKKLDSI